MTKFDVEGLDDESHDGVSANRDVNPGDVNPDDVNPDDVNPDDVNPDDVNHDDVNHDDVNHGDVNPDVNSDANNVNYDASLDGVNDCNRNHGRNRDDDYYGRCD